MYQGHLLVSPLQDEGHLSEMCPGYSNTGEDLCISISVLKKVRPPKMALSIGAAALEDVPEHPTGCE